MRFSVCIDMMFSGLEFSERFAAVRRAGLDAVEFWKWSNKDLSRVRAELQKNDLAFSIFNLDSADEKLSADLSRGILNAGRKQELRAALEESIPIYHNLHASGMIVLVGETLPLPREVQLENVLECLREVRPIAEQAGVTLLLEPLNDRDRKNYFLPRSEDLFPLLEQIDSPNVRLLFDLYHEQTMRGDVIRTLTEHIDRIGHFHVADVPGRHEPGTGEMNYPNILRAIRAAGYDGYVGLEYRATRPDETTLDFLRRL